MNPTHVDADTAEAAELVADQADGCQVVSIWASQKDAEQMVSTSADFWTTCKEAQPFTVTTNNGTEQWTAGPVDVARQHISGTAQRQQPTPRTCSHIVAAS